MTTSFLHKAAPLVLYLGWPVLPVSRKKVPLVKGGFHAATTDKATIEKWSDEFHNANVAVPTGKPTGLLVIDIDGPVGEFALDRLQARMGWLPPTVEAITARGRHLYFRYAGHTIPSKSAVLGTQVDHKADNGCVITPPSVHSSGFEYRWRVHPKDQIVSPAPRWLLEALRKRERTWRPVEPKDQDHPAPEALLRRLDAAQPGTRNNELNRVAFLMGLAVKAGRLTVNDAKALLGHAAAKIGLGRQEATKTINSGLYDGMSSA